MADAHVQEAISHSLEVQNTRSTREADIKNLQRIGKTIFPCDGTNRLELRKWLEGVEHAKVWTKTNDQTIIEFIGGIVSGGLAQHIRNIVFSGESPVTTWDDLKAKISKAFLGEEEPQFLRDVVLKNFQAPSESVREYGRRFVNDANRAFSAEEQRVPLVMESLIQTFIRGILAPSVRVQAFQSKPTSLEAAVTAAVNFAYSLEQAQYQTDPHTGFAPYQPERVETPMDQSAMDMSAAFPRGRNDPWKRDTKPPPSSSPNSDPIAQIKKDVASLVKDVKELKLNAPKPPRNRQNNQTCFTCKKVGHIARNCYAGRRQLNPNAPVYQQRGPGPNPPAQQPRGPPFRPKGRPNLKHMNAQIDALVEVVSALETQAGAPGN